MSIEIERLRGAIQRFLTPNTRFVRTKLNGHSMIIDTADPWMKKTFLWCDIYEPETTAFIEANVQKGDIVIDVGAHIGYHALNFARAGARVFAFEPDPKTFALLCANMVTSIIPINSVVSDVNGEVTFYRSMGGSAWNSLIPRCYSTPVKLHSSVIDDMHLGRLDWVKIDVEGAEMRVLKGMRKTLARFPDLKLIIEWLPRNGGDLEGILEFLDGWQGRPMDHNMLFWRADH